MAGWLRPSSLLFLSDQTPTSSSLAVIYKKLSFRRDSARRSLITPFCMWTILMDILARTVFQLSRSIDQIIAFDRGCLSLTHSFSVISLNVATAINYILPKILGQHFCRSQCRSASTILLQIALKYNTFGVIKQNNGIALFKVIQGYRFQYQSKAHIGDFLLVINANLHPISHRF